MTKPRVYLGTIAIVPRKKFSQIIENPVDETDDRLETAFHGALRDIFALPPAPPAEAMLKTDLCIDVTIAGYSTGLAQVDFFIPVPLFWRPKIALRARLYGLSNRKTVRAFSITQRPTWREYLSRAFSWRTTTGSRAFFDENHMEVLLNRASMRLLEGIAAVAYK